jgi:hypothetical protein
MSTVWAVIIGVLPSVGIGLLFWWIMRNVVHADRNEREALAKLDARENERRHAEPGKDG